jgi:hypothetical protein
MSRFEDATRSLGWAAATLVTASATAALAAAAASTHLGVLAVPGIAELGYHMGKQMLLKSEKHMQAALNPLPAVDQTTKFGMHSPPTLTKNPK